jgi:hypothetical protein
MRRNLRRGRHLRRAPAPHHSDFEGGGEALSPAGQAVDDADRLGHALDARRQCPQAFREAARGDKWSFAIAASGPAAFRYCCMRRSVLLPLLPHLPDHGSGRRISRRLGDGLGDRRVVGDVDAALLERRQKDLLRPLIWICANRSNWTSLPSFRMQRCSYSGMFFFLVTH